MAITLEIIYREIQQVKTELNRLRTMLEDESELTDEACQKHQKAREEMDKGKYISHKEVKAEYGC